jgi:trans-aconitate 3-methyltransferase
MIILWHLATGTHYPELPNPQPVILHKRMHWDDLLAYFRTFSSLHTFHERNPGDVSRPDGDLALRFWHTLRERARDEGHSEEHVDVEWPLTLIMVRRK